MLQGKSYKHDRIRLVGSNKIPPGFLSFLLSLFISTIFHKPIYVEEYGSELDGLSSWAQNVYFLGATSDLLGVYLTVIYD